MPIRPSLSTPAQIFSMPQQLLVPLFQRPYTWNLKEQWNPLWEDVARCAERSLEGIRPKPHFLGAIVLQQLPHEVGKLTLATIIDGQQRLTTLQILLDATHAEFIRLGFESLARKLELLIENGALFQNRPDDIFKLWPTNIDRRAYAAVLGAPTPIDYDSIPEQYKESKFFNAHVYFAREVNDWVCEGEDSEERAKALLDVIANQLNLVVITLDAEDDAQEIFETLNARGARLEAADLIKNYVFQKLMLAGYDIDKNYIEYWAQFEGGKWAEQTTIGREKFQLSSIFLFHWLISRSSDEVLERELYVAFKAFVEGQDIDVQQLLKEIADASRIYLDQVIAIPKKETVEISRLELFNYRMSVLENSIHRPLLLDLFSSRLPQVSQTQIEKSLDVIESWFLRRALLRASTSNYNRLFAEAIVFANEDRDNYGNKLEEFFINQQSNSGYWPDNEMLISALIEMPFHSKIKRSRQRMILEALEDYLRGWIGDKKSKSGSRVIRETFQIEHVMPQSWEAHWPLSDEYDKHQRNYLVQTLGNLTLLTGSLNSEVSNGPWVGAKTGKKEAIENLDLLQMNKELIALAEDQWNEKKIQERTLELAKIIAEIWSVPEGHRVNLNKPKKSQQVYVSITDLISANLIEPGTVLYPRRNDSNKKTASIQSDGRILVDNHLFETPSGAAIHLRGRGVNGWVYWYLDEERTTRLSTLRDAYRDMLEIESDEEDIEESDED